jgi:hypothetical protein
MKYWLAEYKVNENDTFVPLSPSFSCTRREAREWLTEEKYYLGFSYRKVYPITRIVQLIVKGK